MYQSNQIKFINIRQQMIKSTHVKKKQNEQREDIKGRGRP